MSSYLKAPPPKKSPNRERALVRNPRQVSSEAPNRPAKAPNRSQNVRHSRGIHLIGPPSHALLSRTGQSSVLTKHGKNNSRMQRSKKRSPLSNSRLLKRRNNSRSNVDKRTAKLQEPGAARAKRPSIWISCRANWAKKTGPSTNEERCVSPHLFPFPSSRVNPLIEEEEAKSLFVRPARTRRSSTKKASPCLTSTRTSRPMIPCRPLLLATVTSRRADRVRDKHRRSVGI